MLCERRVQAPPLQRKGDVGPPLQRDDLRPHVLPVHPVEGAQQVLHHCRRRTAVIGELRVRCCCAPGCAMSQCISSQHRITAAAAVVTRCGDVVHQQEWRLTAGVLDLQRQAVQRRPRRRRSLRLGRLAAGDKEFFW